MEQLQQAIAQAIDQAVAQRVAETPAAPEFCMVADIVKEYKISRETIDALVHGSPSNGFPAVRLGPKTIRIDRRRFYTWLNAGGLATN